jgi:putative ABC transport system substrate-binding protein
MCHAENRGFHTRPSGSIRLLTARILTASARKALFIYWRGETDCEKGLKDGLQSAGVNVSIVEFNAEQHKQNLDNFVSSIDEKQYDFIYTFGTTVTETVSAHVKKTPILFGIVASPVKAGIIDSWESPGKNVTGISHILPMQEQVDFIFRLGNYKRIGMLYNPKEENSQIAH